jgi:hypothetical protein
MNAQTIIIFTSSGIILVLMALNALLFLRNRRINKILDDILEKGKIKNFKDVFLKQKERNDELEEQIKEAVARIKALEDISQITIKKVGIVRYNPFNDMGGNQSFVVALLDSRNNGFLISSLFGQEGTRVYAKTIKQGKPDYMLSGEEQEALARAISSGNPKS